MPITIIQQPQSLTLVGCIPDIIVETTGLGMVVNLKVGATVLLAEYYTADQAGRARVNLRDFIDEQLEVEIPTSDLFEQTKSWKTFTVDITVGTDVTSFNFIALKGGSSKLTLDCPAFIKEAWLTWQVQTKQVHDVDPEWLSYFAQYDADVKVKAWFTGGISETITLHELLAGKHYSMNMTFSDIRELFVAQPIYFDVWVENKAAAPVEFTTWQIRYVLTLETFDYDDLFVFKNGLGGIDTIRFTGESHSVNPMEVGAALFYDEYEIDYLVTPRLAVEKNTGFFRSKEAMLWAQDFFLNKQRYIYQEEALVPIRLISPETITQDLVLVSYDFTYGYTRQTNYLALFKKKSPLIDPIIIGPGDSEFYLPPVISEFPQQTDPEGLLFPVQKPGVPGWFFITWENMLAEILGVLPEVPPVPSHNELLGLQGGSPAIGEAPAERYHLTAEELATAQGITRSVDGLGAPVQYQFPVTVKGQSATEPDEFVTLSQLPTVPQYGLLSGGTIFYSGTGQEYLSSLAVVAIGTVLNAPASSKTLDAAHATWDRFDVLGWRYVSPGVAELFYLKGDAAASPTIPQVNPELEVEGKVILVLAASTVPTGITTQPIYEENTIPPEWTPSTTGTGTSDPANTENPKTLTKAVKISAIQNGFKQIFTRSAVLDISPYNTLGLDAALIASLGAGQGWIIGFLDASGNPASNTLALPIDKALTAYQFLALNLDLFTFTSTSIKGIVFTYVRTKGGTVHAGIYLDNIKLQGGVDQPETPGGTNGTNGWSPVFAVVSDGDRRVLQVTDWVGGTGTEPTSGLYVGVAGFEVLIANGVDVRGSLGIDGVDGREIELQVNGSDMIQYRYVGVVSWTDLFDLTTLGGGGGGHVIKNVGTPLTQRAGLNFSYQFIVTDDAVAAESKVEIDENIMATRDYVNGGATTANAASRLYLFNNY